MAAALSMQFGTVLAARLLSWLSASALLLPCTAHAWGAEGHRIVALIAQRELTPQVRLPVG